MLDVISLFEQRDTRDEMGIASIRDSFADQFFPGTSTIQTRARYFLFVPWMYQALDRKGIPAAEVVRKAKNEEIRLIFELLKADDTEGVIGRRSKEKLQRLPSNIYWQGLKVLGILNFPGPQEEFHRQFAWLREESNKRLKHDDECGNEQMPTVWHDGLPAHPPRFPEKATLDLEPVEAQYLKERVLTRIPESLLAFFLAHAEPCDRVSFIWEHPDFGRLPSDLKEQVDHARLFSECMHGAVIIYNLMLAEQTGNREWKEVQLTALRDWNDVMESQSGAFARWDRDRFWTIAYEGNPRIPGGTKLFVDTWIDLLAGVDQPASLAEMTAVRQRLADREVTLKRDLARLKNRRTLELWSGERPPGQLDFRWAIAQQMLGDIYTGIDGRN
jgi:hypothetical protein